VALAVPLTANALTLDWTTDPWPDLTDREEVIPVDGDNVTVRVTDDHGVIMENTEFFRDGGAPGSLATNGYLSPGPPSDPGTDSFFIKTDQNTNTVTSGDYITVEIEFAHIEGVTDVEMSFFDVDMMPYDIFFIWATGFQDEIEISGSYQGGASFAPTSVTANTGSPTWGLIGSANSTRIIGNAAAGVGDDDGTAVVTFDQVLDKITFKYKNTLNFPGLDNGQVQFISLSNINFERAPEPSTGLLLALGLLMLAAHRQRL
jgi:hypothetical protein